MDSMQDRQLLGVTLCDLGTDAHHEMIALWLRAGLHIRPEGRDSPEALAQQQGRGTQRVIGLRLPAGLGQAIGTLIGLAVLTHDGRKGWINRLAVDPDYRRRGLARQLIAEAERWFTEDVGLEVWAALIESENGPSRSLFADAGFTQLDVVYVTRRVRPNA